MMKNNYLSKACAALAVCAAVCAGTGTEYAGAEAKETQIAIDAETFPDENFRAIASGQADTNQDGMLSEEEIKNVTKITVRYPHQEGHPASSGISCDTVYPVGDNHNYDGVQMDFTGMGIFRNLKILKLHNVEPTGLPFAELGSLKQFYLSSAPAVELDFSKAQGLERIEVVHTDVTKLNLKKNTALKRLQLRGCGLEQADFSRCRNLERLWLDYNAFKSIDLTKNSRLRELHLEYNSLAALDLTKNKQLESLDISFNRFKKINSSTLKVSASSRLSEIQASMLTKCTLLDVSHINSLQNMNAASGKFKKVKIGKNLQMLDISSGRERANPMTVLNAKTLQAPAGAKLRELQCYQGNLKKLDLRHLKNLRKLLAEDSRLTEADLSGNLKMKSCNLDGNPLKTLAVSRKSNAEQKKMYRKIVKRAGGKLIYK